MAEELDIFEGYEEPIGFEIDVRTLVLTNLKLVLEGIDALENAEINDYVQSTKDVEEAQPSFISFIRDQHDLLRSAAVHLAMVGLVTRYHHWLIKFANELRPSKEVTFDMSVQQEMHFLNKQFSPSPHKPHTFEKWVTVRDSIVHADAKATWLFDKKPRNVDPQFNNGGELNFTEKDLQDAYKAMLAAIGWYETEYDKWYVANHGTGIIFK
jgi:hypothetical protein